MGLLDRAVARMDADQGERAPDRKDGKLDLGVALAGSPGQLDKAGRANEGAVAFPAEALARKGIIVPGFSHDRVLLDEYRRIKRGLLFRMAEPEQEGGHGFERSSLMLVTSALSGEGKTFTALNLAFSLSLEVDRSALLIDGDVIRGGASSLLGLQDYPGLVDYLAGDVDDLTSLLVQLEGVDNLQVLPAGRRDANVNELLAGDRMANLLTMLAQRQDELSVIFDAPPLLVTSEVAVLAQQVGQIALVVRADTTAQHHVEHALGMIAPERFSGLILNAASRNFAGDGIAADYYYG